MYLYPHITGILPGLPSSNWTSCIKWDSTELHTIQIGTLIKGPWYTWLSLDRDPSSNFSSGSHSVFQRNKHVNSNTCPFFFSNMTLFTAPARSSQRTVFAGIRDVCRPQTGAIQNTVLCLTETGLRGGNGSAYHNWLSAFEWQMWVLEDFSLTVMHVRKATGRWQQFSECSGICTIFCPPCSCFQTSLGSVRYG